MPILIWLGSRRFVLLVAFGAYGWLLWEQLAYKQMTPNIGAWLMGSILGGALAFLLACG